MYIILLFISCARLFYFADRFSFLFSRTQDFFLFRRSFFFLSFLSSRVQDFIISTLLFRMSFFLFYYLVRMTFFYNPTLYIKGRALHQKINQQVVCMRQWEKTTYEKKSRAHEIVEKNKRHTK